MVEFRFEDKLGRNIPANDHLPKDHITKDLGDTRFARNGWPKEKVSFIKVTSFTPA